MRYVKQTRDYVTLLNDILLSAVRLEPDIRSTGNSEEISRFQ